jgi:hypothetical protein
MEKTEKYYFLRILPENIKEKPGKVQNCPKRTLLRSKAKC